ncbi:MAG: SusC/RagA family TonB-linked outer membrane protein, partial [Candidatus Symbiothrix sp.]|nr:SusC/RagA family TonB-linked outer membrane protein [Candidatus Symbiothrix sp.]
MKKKLKMNLNWNFLRKLLFIACFSVSAVLTYAQGTKTVTGTALDENGKPLVGVNISVKGTQNRTLTDAGGNFSLSVTNQDVLVFSYIGFITQEKTVGTTTNFSIVMDEDSILLEDIVIVGYATVKKANLTGAVDQIDGRILADRPITSVAQALQGTIANLNISSNNDTGTAGGGAPGAKMSLNIRGVTGLSNGSEFTSSGPLFVIDGIQGGDINSVNPDDIASISVLKDAASAAIYGSNAPYGVVLITTKKGAKTGKPVLTYSTNVGWSSAINMPTMVNSVEWMKIMNDAQQNTKGINFLSAENMQRIQDYYDGKITTPTVVNAGRTGDQTWSSFDDFGNGLSNDNINWYDVYFRENASTQQHNVSLSGGSQNSTYYIGLGYNQKNGLLKYGDDTFNRYSLRANLSSDVTKWLTANVRSSYTVGITDRPSQTGNDNFLQQIAQRWPIIPLKNNDGRYSSNSNIDAYQYGGRNITTDNITVLTGELVAKPMKGWDITFNYTYKANNIANEKNTLHYTLYDAFDVPFYAPGWTSDGFSIYTRGKDELYRERTDDTQHTINAFTSYEWEKNGHYLKGMAGFAQEYVHYYKLTASSGAVTLYTTELPTFNTMYYTTNNQSIGETSKRTLTTRGTFGRINYGYKDRYLLELNGRYDGSSRYMKDVRFKFYPGLSGAWVVSQENFWGESLKSYVDFLKIRASYGSLGEQSGSEYYPFYPNLRATAATSSAESYKYSNWLFNGSRYSSLSFPGIVNPNLTWITSTTVDFGFDITTLKNRLSATFDWYRRSSDDVVGPAEQLPAVLGVAAPSKNNASLETKGFE